MEDWERWQNKKGNVALFEEMVRGMGGEGDAGGDPPTTVLTQPDFIYLILQAMYHVDEVRIC